MASRLTKPGLDNHIVSTDATLDAGSQLGVRQEVVVTSSSGAALPLKVDDAAFAVGTDTVTPIGAMLDNTSPDEVNERDVGVLRMTQRGLHVLPYNAAGTLPLFPDPAAMANTVANPTLTKVGAYGMGFNGTTWDRIIAGTVGDTTASSLIGQYTVGRNMLYDAGAATWNMQRANSSLVVLASAARTALINSSDIVNYNWRGAVIYINITAFTAGSITVTIKGKDEVGGGYSTILASAALAAVALTPLTIYPGVTVAANSSASTVLPRLWRAEVAVGSADSITYSISVSYVL